MTATAIFVGADGGNSGIDTPGSVNVTIPAGAQVGDEAIVFGSWNNATAPVTAPSGSTLIGSQTITTVLTTAVWSKTIDAGQAGTVLSVPAGAGGRMAAGIIVWRDADLTLAPLTSQVTTNATNQTIPTIIPNGDAFVFALLGYNVQTGGTGFTPPTGWTERVDEITTHATGNLVGCSIFTKNVEVASGVGSGSAVATVDTVQGRSNIWTFAVKNGIVVASVAGWTIGSISMGH